MTAAMTVEVNDRDDVLERSKETSYIEEFHGDFEERYELAERFEPTNLYRTRFGGRFSYENYVRHPAATKPMNSTMRFWVTLKRLFLCLPSKKGTSESSQVRIPRRRENNVPFFRKGTRSDETIIAVGAWFQQTSFINVLLVFLLVYTILIVLFQFILFAFIKLEYNRWGYECCIGYDFESPRASDNFEVVFELSWTTFATVGYGSIAVPADESCRTVRYTTAIEAFIGILYSSLCGAILFGKIGRLQTRAHVTFSSAICLLYGKGITDPALEVDVSRGRPPGPAARDVFPTDESIAPFPVLEMRVANDRANTEGSEIVEARIEGTITVIEETENDDIEGEDPVQTETRSFLKLPIKPDNHPCFAKGVWYFRHILDGESPLLKSSVINRIKKLGGWPSDLNTPALIRRSFSEKVDEIVFSLSGKSNLTADTVYISQNYQLSDTYIGWRFAGMAYLKSMPWRRLFLKHKRRDIGIDLSLVHDIVPVTDEAFEVLDIDHFMQWGSPDGN